MSKKQYNPIWERQRADWWAYFWGGAKAPWRPTKKEVLFFKNFIKRLLKERERLEILILGSTPEFRDMLFGMRGVKVTLIDLNLTAKKGMDKLCRASNKREKLVMGDWLKMNHLFPFHYFDVIVNDEGFENIDVKKHTLLFKNIHDILKRDGYFLSGRACLEPLRKTRITFKQFFAKYKKDPHFFHNFYNRLWYLYRLIFSPEIRVYDYKKQGGKLGRLATEVVKKAAQEKIYDIKYLNWDHRIDYRDPSIRNYMEVDICSWKRLKKMITKYFIIQETYQDLFHPVMKQKYNFILSPKN
ncbi:MAG: methyltransferase domain-containing protein [Patescibacteria group bacterium]|nr:methyltransferase domain-containing protein [Patescibacteria group bacterium]MDD5121026.1 methyltransferase domain-containing protein [Patescibacteria group bacterium]MDD5221613.1 methyltransferase domain-containing protein [Patescibacteria group bacterium]MDD5396055.1 methyltransferase domain-containing protein [Patescibacteria group bacterium]